MPQPDSEFAALLDAARGGDEGAIARLVTNYEQEVRLVARMRLGAALRPYLDSLDLVQSVHRSLMVGLRQGRFDISTPDRLIALAITIVRRKVARQWRHLRRQERLEGRAVSDSVPDLLAQLQGGADPSETAALNDQMQRLWQQLDPVERRLVELRIEGQTTADAAREMGVDPDVLRVKLSRLRQRLKSLNLLTDWI